MRIAYICKRQYMSHDVIVDRYARLYEQPYQLAANGNEVLGICPSYRETSPKDEFHDVVRGRLRWVGLTPRGLGRVPLKLPGFAAYPKEALEYLHEFHPHLVVGASDCLHVILAQYLAKKLRVPFAADLYDHFESFALARIPGIKTLFRNALRQATLVSCVSEPLANLVRGEYRVKGKVICLPSTINTSLFHPISKFQCRQRLGLPLHAKLIGTAGGLSGEKGIAPVFRAYEALAQQDSDLHLVLAGKLDPSCPPPSGKRVHYLGMLSHADTAVLFNALDVGIVYIRDTPYGRFSFPQKAYEMAACETPMAVTRIGAMATLFQETPEILYEPDDTSSLIDCIKQQLRSPIRTQLHIPTWAAQAAHFLNSLPMPLVVNGNIANQRTQ